MPTHSCSACRCRRSQPLRAPDVMWGSRCSCSSSCATSAWPAPAGHLHHADLHGHVAPRVRRRRAGALRRRRGLGGLSSCRTCRTASPSGSIRGRPRHHRLPAAAVAVHHRRRRRARRRLGRGFLLFPNGHPVVPDMQTDFIFTAVASEMGMLGAVGVILVFLLFCGGASTSPCGRRTASPSCWREVSPRLRPPDLHHHRRRHAAHPAHRHHAAVRELRRQLPDRQPHAGGAAADGHQPRTWCGGAPPRAPPAGGARVAGVNQAIVRIFIVAVVLFAALIANLTVIMAVRAECTQSSRRTARHRQGDEDRAGRDRRLRRLHRAGSRAPLGLLPARLPPGHARAPAGGLRQPALRAQRHRGRAQRRPHRAGHRLGCRAGWTGCSGARRRAPTVRLTLVPAVQKEAQQALAGQNGAVVVLDPRPARSSPRPRRRPSTRRTSKRTWRAQRGRRAPLLNRPCRASTRPARPSRWSPPPRAWRTVRSPRIRSSSTPARTWCSAARRPTTGARSSARHAFTTASPTPSTPPSPRSATSWAEAPHRLHARRYGFYADAAARRCPTARWCPAAATAAALLPPDASMDPLAVAWAACGQERLIVTPLQMMMVAGAVANGGVLMAPRLMQRVTDRARRGGAARPQPRRWTAAMTARTPRS